MLPDNKQSADNISEWQTIATECQQLMHYTNVCYNLIKELAHKQSNWDGEMTRYMLILNTLTNTLKKTEHLVHSFQENYIPCTSKTVH